MLSSRQKFVKRIALPLALVVFLGLFVTDIFFVPRASLAESRRADSSATQIEVKIVAPKKASEPEDVSISKDLRPRIDDEAATIVRETKAVPVCATLSGELWIFLLTAYLFLLFFNLFYDFERSGRRHWFWESLYTLLALWGWYAWDSCHLNIWFPLYVLKLGVIVYLVYLYLFYKQKEMQPLTEEDLENFEA